LVGKEAKGAIIRSARSLTDDRGKIIRCRLWKRRNCAVLRYSCETISIL